MTCRLAPALIASLALSSPTQAWSQSYCDQYGSSAVMGFVSDLNESSGLAPSHINPEITWTHNDSGDSPRIYGLTLDGHLAISLTVSGATARDWEDMDLGPCPSACACLYMGDIGDNEQVRGGGTLFRVVEPLVASGALGAQATVPLDRALTFTYPDGPHNAETMFVDPRTGIPYIVTKEQDGHASVFRFPSADPASLPATLIKVADLDLTGRGPLGRLTTGGSVSSDGARAIVRTYKEAWEWWIGGGDLDDVWEDAPLKVELPRRKQGEAIAFTADGQYLLTTTEGEGGRLDRIPCISGEPLATPLPALTTRCAGAASVP